MVIVAGFGFRAAATEDSLRSALAAAAGAAAAATEGQPVHVGLLATAEDKAGAPPLMALASGLGVRVADIGTEALAAVATPTRSARVLAARRTGSVAEAAALAAAGPGARLIARRHVSADRLATCALAATVE